MRYLLASFLLLTACAQDENGPTTSPYSDAIFKTWSGGALGSISMEGMHYGNNDSAVGSCQCTLAVNGWANIGMIEVKFCTTDGFNTSGSCTNLHKIYDYESDGSHLELCELGTSTCSVYY